MKQWDMQHIGIFDINFDTGEHYWSAELRRILKEDRAFRRCFVRRGSSQGFCTDEWRGDPENAAPGV